MRIRGLVIAGLVALMVAGIGSPAWAEKGDRQIRFGLVLSTPMDDLSEGAVNTEFDSATGFQFSFEQMLTDMIGIEPGLSSTSHDLLVQVDGFPETTEGDIDLLAVTVNLNFHLLDEAKADLYVGPTVGLASWGDLNVDADSFSTSSEVIFGVNAGVDVPFGEGPWGFAAAINYLFAEVDAGGDPIGVDPLNLKVGVFRRF